MSKGRAFCLTVPLLVNADGKKMGKTEGGAVWLDPEMTSPFDYFQYWRNQPDDMVGPCLRYFTFLPMEEINRLTALEGAAINDAKVVLAFEATRIVHGEAAAITARDAAAQLHAGTSDGSGAPEVLLRASAVGEKLSILDLLVLAQVVPSKGEARRLIDQGGLLVEGEKVNDSKYEGAASRLNSPTGLLLKKGKKHYYRLRISD
jgi:tyrosyl-tRNA synthetase